MTPAQIELTDAKEQESNSVKEYMSKTSTLTRDMTEVLSNYSKPHHFPNI
jgi:hypothetical protein